MSTRTRSTKSKKSKLPVTQEQIQQRINELQAIGVKNHHELAAKSRDTRLSNGLWFPADFLPADLKAEWDTLTKEAA